MHNKCMMYINLPFLINPTPILGQFVNVALLHQDDTRVNHMLDFLPTQVEQMKFSTTDDLIYKISSYYKFITLLSLFFLLKYLELSNWFLLILKQTSSVYNHPPMNSLLDQFSQAL